MTRVAFATWAVSSQESRQALLLASSIRTFGGELRSGAIWVLRPDRGDDLEPAIATRLASLGAEPVVFPLGERSPDLPHATKVAAAAAAETRAAKEADLLVWMDPDTLVLNDAGVLLLPEGKAMGWAPVHLRLVGTPADEAPSPFWALLYKKLRVRKDAAFAITTAADRRRIRAYFNAGMVVARPGQRIMRRWLSALSRLADDSAMKAFFIEDAAYHTFFHQAVLTASVLAAQPAAALLELPHQVNYPLHLIAQIPAERRPWALNDLVTCRYDDLAVLAERSWKTALRVDEPLRSWLDDMVPQPGPEFAAEL